ncbi:MAG: Gfo/Idh/MocA family oxidoreductase [Spirochaetales bacterium]|nr:Gfo/Idh/MocA family oxidoreductase [Spirochaetales bacterium]
MQGVEKLRCSFIGLGRIASLLEDDPLREKPCTHAGAVSANPDCVITGGCDNVRERRDLFSGRWGCPVFDNPVEMLEKTDPDIVFIATHPDSHLEMTQYAISKGVKVIVCEKPLADTLKKSREISSCHEKGLSKIITNHERRYSEDYILAKKRIEERTYGDLLSVSAFLYMGKNKRIIDVMWHDGTHLADAVMFLTGCGLKRKKITGRLGSKTGTVHISAEAGKVPVLIQCGAGRDHLVFSFELSFESGMIRIGNGIYEEWISGESPYYSGFMSLIKKETPVLEKTGYFKNMVKDAVRAAREPDYNPVSTAVDGYRAVKFLSSLK